MKKFALVITLHFLLNISAFATGGKGGLVIGDKSKNCVGTGFCKATHTSTNLESNFYLNEETRAFTISFTISNLKRANPEMAEELEGKNTFIITTNCDATPELSERLGANGVITILKGNYPLTEQNGIYTITIPSVEISNE